MTISNSGALPTEIGGEGILSFCNNEIERAMSDYPGFTNLYGEQDHNLAETSDVQNPHSPTVKTKLSAHIHERAPYWSAAEEKEFPELLARCGRDFRAIADSLKSKTAEEVAQHLDELIKCGKAELSEIINTTDARLTAENLPVDSISRHSDTEEQQSQTAQVSLGTLGGSTISLQDPTPNSTITHVFDLPGHQHTNLLEEPTTRRVINQPNLHESPNEPKGRKRKPLPRTICLLCEKELHDESAMRRHQLRFHTATRKVWVCEDISIDKRFLNKCKSYSASKRYQSRAQARKHLRQHHFNNKTSIDTLRRWMQEVEEPNPRYNTSTERAELGNRPANKRAKTKAEPASLPPVLFDPSDSRLDRLPPIKTAQDQPMVSREGSRDRNSSILGSDSEDDNRETGVKFNSSGIGEPLSDFDNLLTDVSFDNVLGLMNGNDHLIDIDGPPHRCNRALIKPGQVQRLPNLDPSRKTACQDQVDALYYRLDAQPVGTAKHQEELENLTSLSRTLMSNLRDWRRLSYPAISIPLSI